MLCQVMYEQNGSVRENHMDCQIDTITRYMCGRRCRFNHLESRYDTTDNVSERGQRASRGFRFASWLLSSIWRTWGRLWWREEMESEIERLGRYSPCQWGGFYLWNSDWVLLWQLNLETSKRYSAEEDLPKCRKDQLRVWSSAVSEGIRNVKSIRPSTRRGMPKTITSIKSSFSYYSLLRFYLTEGWSKPKQRMEMKKTNIMLTETHLLFRLAR